MTYVKIPERYQMLAAALDKNIPMQKMFHQALFELGVAEVDALQIREFADALAKISLDQCPCCTSFDKARKALSKLPAEKDPTSLFIKDDADVDRTNFKTNKE